MYFLPVFSGAMDKISVAVQVANSSTRADIRICQAKLYSNGSSISVIFDTVTGLVSSIT